MPSQGKRPMRKISKRSKMPTKKISRTAKYRRSSTWPRARRYYCMMPRSIIRVKRVLLQMMKNPFLLHPILKTRLTKATPLVSKPRITLVIKTYKRAQITAQLISQNNHKMAIICLTVWVLTAEDNWRVQTNKGRWHSSNKYNSTAWTPEATTKSPNRLTKYNTQISSMALRKKRTLIRWSRTAS